MNKDFHYYGTFYAAINAGYTYDESIVIANAAQFVDELTASKLKKKNIDYYTGPLTCMEEIEMVSMNTKPTGWTQNDRRMFNEIWVAFHFLPGNWENDYTYTGEESYTNLLHRTTWRLSEEDRRELRLLCVKNSDVAHNMIQNAISKHPYDSRLHLIVAGMCMHVYADTWAHHLFMGRPRWFANQIGDDVFIFDRNANRYMKAKMHDIMLWLSDNIETRDFMRSPTMVSFESTSYLGHGRAGHLPDYPSLTFRYTPHWGVHPILRNNTTEFCIAFHYMYKALTCMRQNTDFTSSLVGVPNLSAVVLPILNTNVMDQSDAWANALPLALPGLLPGNVMPPYNVDAWFDQYKLAHDTHLNMDDCWLSKFSDAAAEHIRFANNVINLCHLGIYH